MNNYTQVERVCGSPCWQHNAKHVFVVEYAATRNKAPHWQAYRAIQPVPKGRKPWTIDNRRIGSEDGFQTLDDALHAGDAA